MLPSCLSFLSAFSRPIGSSAGLRDFWAPCATTGGDEHCQQGYSAFQGTLVLEVSRHSTGMVATACVCKNSLNSVLKQMNFVVCEFYLNKDVKFIWAHVVLKEWDR